MSKRRMQAALTDSGGLFREDTKTQEFLDFEKVHGYNVFKMQASIAVRMPLLQGGILYDYELE